ncbi:hypothetical protein CsSME_00048629 [Camellia sinensis var. sinensis]
MRGRSCSGSSSRQVDKLDNLKEKPHLSGAYIRSLVKQLTSSRTKDPPTRISPKDPDNTTTTTHTTTTTTTALDRDEFHGHQNLTKFGQVSSEGQHPSQPPAPQRHKKQVRRRLHTSRPYQERLLNMAEARREIVTALKFHRAAMKQSNEQRHQPPPPRPQEPQPQHQQLQPPAQQLSVQQGKIKSRRNLPKIYPSTKPSFSNYLASISHSSQTICCSSQNPYSSCPASQIAPPPPSPANPENLNINLTLPSQTLGLNLNFQDFNNLDATMYYKNCNNPSSIYSSSLSPSSSSTSPSTTLPVNTTDQEFPRSSASLSILQQQGTSAAMGDVADPANRGGGGVGGGDLGLHLAMDDQEMAEIRSIGEQHEMEWNDTLNLVTSAWWFKFFKTTKIRPKGKGKDDNDDNDNDNYDDDDDDDDDDDGYYPFDEVMEFPAWLNNSNDGHHYMNDHCSLDDYFQAPALPWVGSPIAWNSDLLLKYEFACYSSMDIGEIEEIDAEWLT